MSHPIRTQRELLGVLTLRGDFRPTYLESWRLFLSVLAVVGIGALLVALLLATLLQRVVTLPIHKLADVARRIAQEKDYSVRAELMGTDEVGLFAYLQSHSIQQYLDNEITPGVNLMKNAGLNPADFAYPYGSESDSLTAALAAYFGHVRGTHSAVYSPLYYEYGSGQLLIQGIGIDDLSYGNTINEIYNASSGAKQEDEIIIFYAHVPVETVSGDYQISYDRLEKILIYGSDNNMKFYTVSELN